jgi:hypothetical protein
VEEIFVNEILEDKHGTHGVVAKNDQVVLCLRTMFGYKIANVLRDQAKSVAEFYLIERFYQYAVFIHFQKKSGFYIKLSDFNKNAVAALDTYLATEAKGWQKSDRDKYVSIVQGIQKEKADIAKLTVAKG